MSLFSFLAFWKKDDLDLLNDLNSKFNELASSCSNDKIPENLRFEISSFITRKKDRLDWYKNKYPNAEIISFVSWLGSVIDDSLKLAIELEDFCDENKYVKNCYNILDDIMAICEKIEDKLEIKKKAA